MSLRSKALIIATLILVPLGLSTATVIPASAAPADDEAAFLWHINQLRARAGAPALVTDSRLTTVARNFARKMANSDGIYHNPDLAAQSPDEWIKLGENVGVGVDEPGLHQAFVNSPGHYHNLVDRDFRYVGIGVVYGGGRMWVVEDFMQTPVAPQAPTVSTSASVKSARAQQFIDVMRSKAPMGLRERIATGG